MLQFLDFFDFKFFSNLSLLCFWHQNYRLHMGWDGQLDVLQLICSVKLHFFCPPVWGNISGHFSVCKNISKPILALLSVWRNISTVRLWMIEKRRDVGMDFLSPEFYISIQSRFIASLSVKALIILYLYHITLHHLCINRSHSEAAETWPCMHTPKDSCFECCWFS